MDMGRILLCGILFCLGSFPFRAHGLEEHARFDHTRQDHVRLKQSEKSQKGHPQLSAGLRRWVYLAGEKKGSRWFPRPWMRPDGRAAVVVELNKGTRSSEVDVSGLRRIGGRVLKRSRSYMLWEVPLDKVPELPVFSGVSRIRAPYPRQAFADGLGDSVAASVELSYAEDFHAGGIKGAGVKVAVIDFGFMGIAAAQSAGELPATLVTRDFVGGGMEVNSDHGVLVAEILMDMAPEASLYLLRVESVVDFENAVDYMAAEGVSIANLSGGWFNASYYDGTGAFSELVNRARDDHNIFFAVSGGNDAQRHWSGVWTDSDDDDFLEFAPGDEQLNFQGTGTVHVNWNQYDAAVTDLDVYVYTASGEVAGAGSFNQTGNPGESFETVIFQQDPDDEPYRLSVERRQGTADNLHVTVFIQGGEILDHPVTAYSMTDPAVAEGAFTIAAARASTWWWEEPTLESFSSIGPTNDGRLKPDLTGPDGISTSTKSPIYGTSYSAPAAAGGAALLLQETPALTALQLAEALRSSARNEGPPGQDSLWGFGLLQLDPLTLDRAPVLSPVGSYSVTESDTLAISLRAWDADGDVITYGDSGLPAGAVLTDSGNGGAEFFWTPDYDQAGDYSVKVSVTANGKTVFQTLDIRVLDATVTPVVTGQQTIAMEEDSRRVLAPEDFTVQDLDNPDGPFTLTLFPGENYIYAADTLAPSPDFNGELTVNLSVGDEDGNVSDPFAATVTVNAVNDAPRLDSLRPAGEVSVREGDSLRFEVFASDPDSGDVVELSWIWKGEEVGAFSSYTLKPGYSDEGQATLYLKIHDGLDTNDYTWSVIVNNYTLPPVPLTPNGSVLTPDSFLVWHPSPDPDLGDSIRYGLELSPDTTFSVFYHQINLNDTVAGLAGLGGSIPDSSTVYWRVWALNDSGYVTRYSEGPHFFTFLLPSILSGQPPVLKNFAGVNYPNPVGNYTLFPIHVNNRFGYQEVIIRLFDIQGRLVAIPLRRMFPPGRHLYKWEPDTPSGFYLYFVEIGGKVLRRGNFLVSKP